MRIRWRKEKPQGFRPREIHVLTDGENDLARVQACGGRQFFWYTNGKNTFAKPTDLATAKAEAKAYVIERNASK